MKIVAVRFIGNNKEYVYNTRLDLVIGATYNIIADNRTTYFTPVEVVRYVSYSKYEGQLREITDAKIVRGAPRPKTLIKNVYFNEKKGTTCVLWMDGTKTIVKCAPGDTFSKEVGLAMCHMKKMYQNRGCFNEVLKENCY